MATERKNICCRICNDTGVKSDANRVMGIFEALLGQHSANDDDDAWCSCAVGVYRRHKSKSSVPT